ncbi:MAG: potassium-transporting ATPase subunit C, partial [Ktedonobacteraceae bacterium]|nr:potassium-transporting ATPase subunit C [Ktedonobacteraceae bacterium]
MSDQIQPQAEDDASEEPSLSRVTRPSQGFWRGTATLGRETWSALKLIVALLILCGVVFPGVVFAIGQLVFPDQANGSLLRDKQGQVIGSKLLGQQFTRPEYFHGR